MGTQSPVGGSSPVGSFGYRGYRETDESFLLSTWLATVDLRQVHERAPGSVVASTSLCRVAEMLQTNQYDAFSLQEGCAGISKSLT